MPLFDSEMPSLPHKQDPARNQDERNGYNDILPADLQAQFESTSSIALTTDGELRESADAPLSQEQIIDQLSAISKSENPELNLLFSKLLESAHAYSVVSDGVEKFQRAKKFRDFQEFLDTVAIEDFRNPMEYVYFLGIVLSFIVGWNSLALGASIPLGISIEQFRDSIAGLTAVPVILSTIMLVLSAIPEREFTIPECEAYVDLTQSSDLALGDALTSAKQTYFDEATKLVKILLRSRSLPIALKQPEPLILQIASNFISPSETEDLLIQSQDLYFRRIKNAERNAQNSLVAAEEQELERFRQETLGGSSSISTRSRK